MLSHPYFSFTQIPRCFFPKNCIIHMTIHDFAWVKPLVVKLKTENQIMNISFHLGFNCVPENKRKNAKSNTNINLDLFIFLFRIIR